MSVRTRAPATPRVISPSPTPSEVDAQSPPESYHRGPVTRSAARKRRGATPLPLEEVSDEDNDAPRTRRSRTRSRSPTDVARVRRLTSRKASSTAASKRPEQLDTPAAASEMANGNGSAQKSNGHLAPPPATPLGWSWRDFSRSPSPLGLIPIHRHWRTFVHKHEVPRKALHVSIGFVTLWLYVRGAQTASVPPWLMAALIPIATVDVLRHHYAPFNRFYIRMLGVLMRESEVDGYNGVIFYLLGAWFVLYFFPKDVGIMGVLLLSWCDTAASTFGRLWGRYTPRIRTGKSLAGTLSAFLVGVATSWLFYGWLAPRTGPFPGDVDYPFMFQGVLRLPAVAAEALGLSDAQATISGGLALGVMSIWSGLVAAGSEVVDIFGWDDNLTIPVLSGLGIWGFLKIFT
ncbi:probable HSD1 ER membrane protein [Cephalotrichum gorgonifer]|uniref:Probable HSD1 ER membrane protein n=1 Tax=Cephalotrichum gorgonifer TaxID=2041049 RepID=A0AAE8SW39_9PEZI|nr:probable HSD1 ER membrane protein [Cephalotrichum gorgonifer]